MKFGGLEPRRYEAIKEIVAPEIEPKSFGTFEKQALGQNDDQPNVCGSKSWAINYCFL